MGSSSVACRRGSAPGGRRDAWETPPSPGTVIVLTEVGGLWHEIGVDTLSLGEWLASWWGRGPRVSGLRSPGASRAAARSLVFPPCPAVAREKSRTPRACARRLLCVWAIPAELCVTPRAVLGRRPESRACVEGGSRRWCSPPPRFLLLIDVVTSRSPGPGLSRAGRGTGIPGEWDRSSRSACGPLSSPYTPVVVRGRGGVRNPARPRSPAFCLLVAGGARGLLTRRTFSARFLAVRVW